MNLKYKSHVENQRQTVATELAARTAILKEKGLDDAAVRRNPTIRKLKAAIRTSAVRLRRIKDIETANEEHIKVKAEKHAAEKQAHEKGKEKTKEKAKEKTKEKTKDIVAKKSKKDATD